MYIYHMHIYTQFSHEKYDMNLSIVNVKQLLMKQEEVIVFIIKHKMKKSVYEIIIRVHLSRRSGFTCFLFIFNFSYH